MPFILGANSLTGGYTVDNSLRFNSASSDYLNRTFGSAGNRKTWTWSGWVKRATLGTWQQLFTGGVDGNTRTYIAFEGSNSDKLKINSISGGSIQFYIDSTQVFRDTSAWYHIVVAVDTTQATQSNRVKAYVNGSLIDITLTNGSLTQNIDTSVNNSVLHRVGSSVSNTTECLDGYMSDVYGIDGQALAADSFGEFDGDSGIWKPIAYEGTYGTNGFYLETKDSGALGADTSGNANNFTVNNLTAVDQTTDTPTNNFATMNPLYAWTYDMSFSDGNLSCSGTQNQWQGAIGSMGINTGKWYYEVKFTSATDVGAFYIGFGGLDDFLAGSPGFRNAVAFYNNDGGEVNVADTSNTAVTTADYGTFANGDIMGVALDYDNELITIYKNGSAIVTNFDYGATSYPSTITDGKTISPVASHYGSGSISFNFGSPPFAISSGNADGNGYGNFEYAVPSGYYSLNTKNLAEYG